MKQSTIISALFGMSFFILSCGNTSTEQAKDKEETATHEEHADHTANALELNNGEKWVVNVEMTPFVKKGEELVNNYVANKGDDYKALATQLKEQNDQLISNCTMDGKSHEVLHVWLHPHLELVKELSNAETKEAADEIITRLKNSYETYNQYFQ
ncbi:MAG: hypothetical protein ABI315_13000 [Bacteroidia bacterium]